ncbi:MAG: LacI family DNA-binding transcriptional regulator [Phycisphaeraceae bacterium]
MTISQTQLAQISGFSRLTVSRVLAEQDGVSDQTRTKILHLAQQHRYRPNAAARAIRSNKTHQIGLLLCNSEDAPFTNPSAFEMMIGINNRLAQEGYMLVVVRIGDVLERLKHDSRVFRERSLDGIIISGLIPAPLMDYARQLIPNCLFVDTNVWQPNDCIRRDEAAAGRMAAKALIEAGYRRLAWLGQLVEAVDCHYSLADRYRGARAVAEEHGVVLEHIPDGLPITSQMYDDFVRRFNAALSPDLGIVAYNTNLALNCMDAAMLHGRLPARDFGLVCCENSHTNFFHMPSLSSVLFDRFEMGKRAAEMMLNRLRSPDAPCPSIRIPCQWRAGGTMRGTDGSSL